MSDSLPHWADQYVAELLERAATLRTYGDDRGAQIAELHASEIEKRRAAFDSEEMSIADAVAESGYTPQALGRLRKEGKWSGRRADLPRHAKADGGPQIQPNTKDGEDAASRSLADQINARRGAPASGMPMSPRRMG